MNVSKIWVPKEQQKWAQNWAQTPKMTFLHQKVITNPPKSPKISNEFPQKVAFPKISTNFQLPGSRSESWKADKTPWKSTLLEQFRFCRKLSQNILRNLQMSNEFEWHRSDFVNHAKNRLSEGSGGAGSGCDLFSDMFCPRGGGK